MSFKSFVRGIGKVVKKIAPIASALLPGIPGIPIPRGIMAIADKFKSAKSKVRKVQSVLGPLGDRSNRGPAPVNDGQGPVNSGLPTASDSENLRTVTRSPIV
jgi:hypothetical protein